MLETGYNFSRMWSNDLEVDNLIQESENYSLQSPGEPCSTLTFKWYICVHPHKKSKTFQMFYEDKKSNFKIYKKYNNTKEHSFKRSYWSRTYLKWEICYV